MYILKNAVKNITRQAGRNILIGSIIVVIAIVSCITLTINNSGDALIKNYKTKNPLEVSVVLDPMQFRKEGGNLDDFELLDLETINEIVKLEVVDDYYYLINRNLYGENIKK